MDKTYQQRIETVKNLLTNGVSSSQIQGTLSAKWSVTKRQVRNYISEANEAIATRQRFPKELSDLYYSFIAASDDSEKYQLWKQATEYLERQSELKFRAPDGISQMDWGRFVKFGWGHPERVKEVTRQ